MGNVTEIESEKEFEDFTKKGFVLIDFFADWCGPCVMMAPVIDELARTFKGKIKFGKVNVDNNQRLAGKFKVFSIPNFVLFQDGEVKDKFVGMMSAEDFEERLKESL